MAIEAKVDSTSVAHSTVRQFAERLGILLTALLSSTNVSMAHADHSRKVYSLSSVDAPATC